MTAPKPGDWVRVTYEGKFQLLPARGCSLEYDDGKGQTVEIPASATIEVLASPVYVNSDADEYQQADVVRDAEGSVLIRAYDVDGWVDQFGAVAAEVEQPLTLLVRNGQAVQP